MGVTDSRNELVVGRAGRESKTFRIEPGKCEWVALIDATYTLQPLDEGIFSPLGRPYKQL